jgi:hypothetical protein
MTMVDDQWEKFLTPEVTRDRLVLSSMYITAFELLRESVIGRLRDFYSIGFDQNGFTVSPEYKSKVLSRRSSVLYASLDWLLEGEVLTAEDLVTFDRLRGIRNKLAHELPSIVLGGAWLELTDHLLEAFLLLKKIERWWVVNVEIPTNPDFDGREINEDGIIPGPVLMLELMLEVANGNTELLKHYRQARPSKA